LIVGNWRLEFVIANRQLPSSDPMDIYAFALALGAAGL